MFTFKKIALLGIAGLTAFTMSCSDPLEEGSGEFKNLVLDRDSEGSVYIKTGTVVADEGVTVTKVEAKSNGTALKGLTGLDLGGKEVDLAGVTLGGICDANKSNKNDDFKILFIATFSDNTTTEVEKTQKVNCSTTPGGNDPDLVKKTVKLSSAGESYADLDDGTTYKQAAAASIKNKIDVVAYNGQAGTGDEIYSPFALNFFFDANDNYLGGSVLLYSLPSSAFTVLNSASKVSDISEFLGSMGDIMDGDDVESVPATKNTAFLVVTTEGNTRAVLITATGTKSVDLSSISMPE